MSRRSSAAKNAISIPLSEPEQIELSVEAKMAVEWIVTKETVLQQQQQQFMANQAEVLKQKNALITSIEKANGLSEGAINRGEWAIINGVLVKQG